MSIFHLLQSTFVFSFGIYVLISGIKKEKKPFFWLSGYGRIIKNPTFNIILGIILILIGIIAFIFWMG